MIVLLSFLFLTFQSSFAGEQTHELVRQPRTMAMGGAGIGLADDEYSLFQNAAGLAGSEDRGFRLVGAGIEASWDAYLSLSDVMSLASSFSIASLDKFMGKDVFVRVSEVPLFQLPHFALAYVIDSQISLNQYNKVNPNFDLGYMTTHGLQFGTAWSFKKGRKAKDEFRVGITGKMLFRKGGYYNVSTAGMLQATGDPTGFIKNLVGDYQMGIGGDLGLQYITQLDKKTSFSMGASITDIGGTRFGDTRTMNIPMSMGIGFGYKKKLDAVDLSFGLDFRNLTQQLAFANKVHLGGEANLGILNFQLGLNQFNMTYGVDFDLWVLKVALLSYGEELGIANHQNTSRRTMLQVNFNMPI